MAVKKDIINDKTYIKVYKNIVGSLSYTFDSREKFWEDDVEYKNLEAREIQDIIASIGGRSLFERNLLIIKEQENRDYFGLEPLSDDILDSHKIKAILTSGDYTKIEEVVSTSNDDELEMIVDVAIKEKLQDRNAIKTIEDYTGLELTDDLAELAKDKPVEKSTTTTKPKREKVAK